MKKEINGMRKSTRSILLRVTAVVMAFVILCAGTAFATTGENEKYMVDIYEGSQVTQIETTETVAEKIVADAGIQLSQEDKLLLDEFRPGEDSKIVICRASAVTFVHTNGKTFNTVFAGTVAELIASQGVVLSDSIFSSVDVNAVVTNNLEIKILSSYDLIINVDGGKMSVKSASKTVGDVLRENNIVLGEFDEVNPTADTALTNEMKIDVLRVEYVTREAKESVPFDSKTEKSSAMAKGTEKITQKGVNGEKIVTYKDKLVNGELQSSEAVSEVVTKKPVSEIKTVGTVVPISSDKLGNSKIEKNGKPISELQLPEKYSIGANNVPTNYKYTITGRAAAYCIPGGTTSTGRKVKPGYIAVDPKQIPYGTELWIVSNDGVVYGYAIAADTGGFVKKGYFTVDLYMNTTDQCIQWGDRGVTIYVL